MVDAMTLISVEYYNRFLKKCMETFLYLRKKAKYITNLFYLMIDSNIRQINQESLQKMIDKFCID
jgi:hypothetical protein